MDIANKPVNRVMCDVLNKLDKDERIIVCMSAEYDFYKQDVLMTMLAPKIGRFDKGDAIKGYNLLIVKDGVKMGFVIFWWNIPEGSLQIKFIFLKPEHRQKGFFTQLITKYRDNKDELGLKTIHLDTKEEGMIRAANKNGFKYVRKCDNGEDLLFTLTL